jgi:hypothetical protein
MKQQFLAIILLLAASTNIIAQKKTGTPTPIKIEGLWNLSKVITYNFGKNKTSTINNFYINFNSNSDAVFHNQEKILHVIGITKKFKNKTLTEIELGDTKDTMVLATLATPEEVLFINEDNHHQEIRDFKIILLNKTSLVFKYVSRIDHRYFIFYFTKAINQNLTSELFDEK